MLKDYMEDLVSHISKVDSKDFPNLDECVLDALELLSNTELPDISNILNKHRIPFVAGSGNAFHTGNILFSECHPVMADQSDYESQLNCKADLIQGGVLISSSGGKDAPAIAKAIKERRIEAVLFTCNPDSPAKQIIGEANTIVFPSLPEPYTYNTSTYGAMIFAKTREDPKKIMRFIKEEIDPRIEEDFSEYNSFYLLIPNKFSRLEGMLQIKFQELFGRRVPRDVFNLGFAEQHATDVVSTPGELSISFGYENSQYGSRDTFLNLPMPKNADYGAMMMIGYYVIGKIQDKYHPHFKECITGWAKARGKKPFG